MTESTGIQAIVVLVGDDGAEVVVGRLDRRAPDLALVDALVRLQLCARRRGARIRVREAGEELRGLLELVGLAEVLGVERVEPRRQPELGEQGGVEEVVQPADPPA